MPHGRYLTAPIFIFNLAGEMMYILNQRLKAQNVPLDKGSWVVMVQPPRYSQILVGPFTSRSSCRSFFATRNRCQ